MTIPTWLWAQGGVSALLIPDAHRKFWIAASPTQEQREADPPFEASFDQAGIGAAILTLDGIPIRVNAAGAQSSDGHRKY